MATQKHTPERSLVLHASALALAVAALTGGMASLSAVIDVSGAVIASGNLVVESELKQVQHPSGGVVSEILVGEGLRVEKDQVLIRLDPTVARASLNSVTNEIWELSARRARLEAERDGWTEPRFDHTLVQTASSEAPLARVLAGEAKLFHFRVEANEGQKAQLRERIKQLHDEGKGLDGQLTAKREEIELVGRELASVNDLWEKKLVPINRVTALEREKARLGGDAGRLEANIAQVRGKVSETELQIIQIDQTSRSDVATQLSEIRAKLSDLSEKRATALDQSQRIDIRASQAGTILNLKVHTLGGVIAAGEQLMQIVPDSDALTVEARLKPSEIHEVKVGQAAILRFTNFNQRNTPEVDGVVTRVSADAIKDERVDEPYYTVRLNFNRSGYFKDVKLLPGMPVEAYIRTDARSLMTYLLKPFSDQMARTFREP